MAGERSMINDVKFIGGHGTMTPGPEVPWKWEENKHHRASQLQQSLNKPGILSTGVYG